MGSKHHEFGPWTSSLDCGSRMELSAFWRRRLGRLSSLGGVRRLGLRGILLLCLLGGAMLMLPRVRLEAPLYAQAPTETPVQRDVAAQKAVDDPPFAATFSNGVRVQLVGLSLNPSQGQQWWAPNGSLLSETPYANMRARMNSGPNGIAREICWRWLDVPENGDVETNWSMDPSPSSSGGRPFDANGKPAAGLSGIAVGLTGLPVKCTLKFSVSVDATPWETAFAFTGSVGTMGRSANGLPQTAMFGERVASDGGTAVTVAYQIPNLAVRLAAVDKAGETFLPTSKTGGGSGNLTQMSYRFAKLDPARIARLELQTQARQYETIEFRDVSLQPDVPTDLKVFRRGPDGKTEQVDVAGAPLKAADPVKTSPAANGVGDRK